MSIPAGQTFDAFSSLIDPPNPSKTRASNLLLTVRNDGQHAGCCFQFRAKQG